MEFLNPIALWGFLGLPLLVLPYLVRRNPHRVVFSSLLLFAGLRSRVRSRPWGRLRLPPIFFLQLLVLALLVLSLSEPVLSVRPSRVALVLDNSASMQAIEAGKTRFELAREQAARIVSELGAAGSVDLYLTTPALEKLNGNPLSPAETARLIDGLRPYDVPDTIADYGAALAQLSRSDPEYDRVYFITDHPARGQTAAVRVFTVGHPRENLAVTGFEITRSSLVNPRLQARVEVANFSARDTRVKLVLKNGRSALAAREIVVPANRSAQALFDGVPAHPSYQAEIAPGDALPLDDRRFAVAPSSETLRILGISPRPQALASLRAIPGVRLDLISPSEYDRASRTSYALEIFHFATPAVLPANSALFVLPPNDNPLVTLGPPVSRPAITAWREPHSLTRYVNFALFRPPYARALKLDAPGDRILETSEGPLAVTMESNGSRYMVLGFDPFPYLGKENLPVSIFTLNLLDWFFEGRRASSTNTGETLKIRPGDTIRPPAGPVVTSGRGGEVPFAPLYQGIYELIRAGQTERLAVNLAPGIESDLRKVSPIVLAGDGPARDSFSVLRSFWPYLVAASLLLLIAEWFLSGSGSPSWRSRAGLKARPS